MQALRVGHKFLSGMQVSFIFFFIKRGSWVSPQVDIIPYMQQGFSFFPPEFMVVSWTQDSLDFQTLALLNHGKPSHLAKPWSVAGVHLEGKTLSPFTNLNLQRQNSQFPNPKRERERSNTAFSFYFLQWQIEKCKAPVLYLIFISFQYPLITTTFVTTIKHNPLSILLGF